MFKRRTFILFSIALLMAAGAVWVAKYWAQKYMQPTVAAKPDTAQVVVAALAIPFGQKIEAAQVKTIEWPRASLPGEHFSDPNQVLGKVTTQTIYPGEVILKSRVREHLGGSTLSALITQNMRAVTVRVNDVVGVGGFLLPGNHVDVLFSKKDNDRVRTETILQGVKVLAVDQEASQDKDKPVVVRAVTLELTPKQAEIMVKATEEGTIQLALRNPLDAQKEIVAASKPAARKPIKVAGVTAYRTVTMINGTRSTLVECTGSECRNKF